MKLDVGWGGHITFGVASLWNVKFQGIHMYASLAGYANNLPLDLDIKLGA